MMEGRGKHSVDAVAVAALEMVAAHPVVILEMADHRLDSGATPHLAADDFGDPAESYRQILVTAGPVRRRRLRGDGRSAWQ
jgi:hypothetical protein